MNIIKKYKSYKAVFLSSLFVLLTAACSENINELQTAAEADGEKGAFARIISSSEDKSTNLLDPNSSSWTATIEFVDNQSGSLIESYSLYATFKDNTIADESAPDHSIGTEVLIDTWNKSSFVAGTNYPELTFTVQASDIITKLGLDTNNADGGDTFFFRGEISLSDGRTFSSTNSGLSINSELFYNDAFGFSSTFVCVPPSPITGDWVIEMADAYGDGWNGGYISVFIDGVEQTHAAVGSGNTVTVNVPSGTQTLEWKYTSGNWESENTFKIYAPSGNLVLSDGPTPATGTLALNLCNESI